MTSARVRRGRKTQALVADRVRHIYPDAEGVAASLPGADVLHTPGVAFECKAVGVAAIPAWLRQATKNAKPGDVPVVVWRPNGFGPESIDDWAAILPLGHFIALLEAKGIDRA